MDDTMERITTAGKDVVFATRIKIASTIVKATTLRKIALFPCLKEFLLVLVPFSECRLCCDSAVAPLFRRLLSSEIITCVPN